MKRNKINPYSQKRLKELPQEMEVVKQLCIRAGGIPIEGAFYKGVLVGVTCYGGKCEKCGKQMPVESYSDLERLHNHEKIFRSQGGRVTKENSLMVCDRCHKKAHGIKVRKNE